MRRPASVILFVFGAWMLSGGVMIAWLDLDQGIGMQLLMVGVMCLLSAPFFLLAVWASPGDGWRELGLTLLITAGVGGVTALIMTMLMNDPSFMRLMPPDQKMPELHFAPLYGIATVLVVGGLGWLLYHRRKPADS